LSTKSCSTCFKPCHRSITYIHAMSTMSTTANQDNLPKDSDTISDNVIAEFTLIEGVDCPPAAEETPVTHTCISKEYESCQVFNKAQINRLGKLEKWFEVTERHSYDKPVDRTERREALYSVAGYIEHCKASFEKVSSPPSHGQYAEACADPRWCQQYFGGGCGNSQISPKLCYKQHTHIQHVNGTAELCSQDNWVTLYSRRVVFSAFHF
jgi:hypothetical protein